MALSGLVAYDASDSENDNDEIGDSPTGQLQLPSARKRNSRSLGSTEEAPLEPQVVRKQWEISEAPKPPARNKQKVKIQLPELIADDSDSDSDGDSQQVHSKRFKPESGPSTSGLLSVLPQPKSTQKSGGARNPFLPQALSRKTADVKSSSPAAVAKVKPKAAAPPVPTKLTTDNDDEDEGARSHESDDEFDSQPPTAAAAATKTGATQPKKAEDDGEPMFFPVEGDTQEEEDDRSGGGMDFLGLSSERQAALGPDDELQPLPRAPTHLDADADESVAVGPAAPTEYVHPSQMYNMADVPQEPTVEQPGPSIKRYTDDQARMLIRRREAGQVDLPPDHDMQITDINLDQKLGPDVRAQLLRNITSARQVGPPSAKADGEDDPGKMAKRKHQITYLAFQAKQAEEKLKEQWANNKQSRRQHAMKYGF